MARAALAGVALLAAAAATGLANRGDSLLEYVKCQLCEVHHLSGRIEGCCTDVESVDATNERHFLPILHDLSKRTFFRYFKVDLWRPCPFWEEDGQCHMRDCAVCECDADEIPACWREQEGYGVRASRRGEDEEDEGEEDEGEEEDDDDGEVAGGKSSPSTPTGMSSSSRLIGHEASMDEGVVAELSRVDVVPPPAMAGGGWALANGVQTKAPAPPAHAAASSPSGSAGASAGVEDDGQGEGEGEGAAVWTEEEEGPNVQYVNLLNNPEGYTAWAGPSAMRVWRAVYEENCFSRSTQRANGNGSGKGKGSAKANGRDYGDGKHTPAAAVATSGGSQAGAGDEYHDGVCGEERVFYRILSGLQTSINTHIAMTFNGGRGVARGTDVYTAGPGTGKGAGATGGDAAGGNVLQRAAAAVRAAVDTWLPAVGLWGLRAWGVLTGVPEKHAARLTQLHASAAAHAAAAAAAGSEPGGADAHAGSHELVLSRGVTPSLEMYIQRIGQHPDRLNNLYFTFLFMLRAVDKAAPLLQALNYSTGNATDDAATAALVSRLLTVEAPAVLRGFDEKALPLMAGLDSWHKAPAPATASAGGEPKTAGRQPQADASTPGAAAGGGAGGGASGVDAVRGAELSDLIDRYKATGTGTVTAGRDVAATGSPSVLPKGAGALVPPVDHRLDPALAMRESWREKYRNISRIMDCIGCEKCRLWGKLQFLGLGTAMKILFAPTTNASATAAATLQPAEALAAGIPSSSEPVPDVRLTRNEVVALVNVLHRVSISVAAVGVMRDLDAQRKLHGIAMKAGSTIIAVAVVTAWMLLWRCRGRVPRKPTAHAHAAALASQGHRAAPAGVVPAAAGGAAAGGRGGGGSAAPSGAAGGQR